ncbi:MAG: molecular chaperone HtpG [Clostridia bacterium]|nr:molecular chaperone HtpG [Clostridia bacterium]
MRKKPFKAESRKLLDMMIHSIYTHKEIFLRELISNASDAIDKLYYRSLSDGSVGFNRADYTITITPDKDARTLTVADNGCGMTADELESNLGVIARSGSLDFKKDAEPTEDVSIIGQFGVGFYSAFMVSDRVEVRSRAFGSEEGNLWASDGVEGYTVEPCEMESHGTVITMHIKENAEEESYDEFLDPYRLRSLVKRYSDYIRYPIRMEMESRRLKEGSKDEYETVREWQTLNSMVPLWRKAKSEITQEEYTNFYSEKFYDYEAPARVIHTKTEGAVTYDALLFVPKHAPLDYYSREYEKGLQLYANGVLIMDKCADLLPDHFSFVKGLVDSADLSLNVSREMLQHDRQLQLIARNIEKKIRAELQKMLSDERETYEEFFKQFGIQLKYGVYSDYGVHKDDLKDLLLFYSSKEKAQTTLAEYRARMPEGQEAIYYAAGETVEKIDMLPQVDAIRAKGYEVLYLTDSVDEFSLQVMAEYDGKKFANVCADAVDLATEEEKEALKKENEESKALLDLVKEALGDAVNDVRFTHKLNRYPVCLTSEGALSVEMEKTLNAMPGAQGVRASTVLEISDTHPVAATLKGLAESDPDKVKKYAKLLYAQARLIGGLSVEDPAELSELICELMV